MGAAASGVFFDAFGTITTIDFGTFGGSYTPITVGSGSNRALLVALATSSATTSSMTWNGVALSSLGSVDNSSDRLELYGLVNPASGTQTLSVSLGAGQWGLISAISFRGVNQTGGTTSFPGFNSGGATDHLNISSSALDLVFAAQWDNGGTAWDGANLVASNNGTNSAGFGGEAYYTGATTVTIGSATPHRCLVGCNVKAA
jgi:hypothetical protein